MTIDEAIKELTQISKGELGRYHTHSSLALKLGIEALKAIKVDRTNLLPFRSTLLLGETEK